MNRPSGVSPSRLKILPFTLFDKLSLVEERCRSITEKFREVYGKKACQAGRWPRRKRSKAPKSFERLGRQIDQVRVREARFLESLEDRFGEDGRNLVRQASLEFGRKLGKRLSLEWNFSLEDREEVKRFLVLFFHDLVPCATATHPCFETSTSLQFRHLDCPLQAYCLQAKVAPDILCEVQGNFLKGLLETTSAHFVKVKTRVHSKKKGVCDECYELS